MLPILHIFNCHIGSYDLMTQISAIIAFIYSFVSLRKLKIKIREIVLFILIGAFVQYFGGVLIPLLYRWLYLHQAPWGSAMETSPGRFFHSVVLSMIAYLVLYCRVFKWPTKKVLDISVVAILIGSSIGRIGCFLQGCCGGKACDLPWAVRFQMHPEERVHPTQIYMFLLETMLWIFLWSFNEKKKYDGQTFWTGVCLYSIYRIGIEFVRTNPIFFLGLTHAQVFSILTLLLSAFMLRQNDSKLQRQKK